MLENYLSIPLRNIRRNPGYSIINITGLVIAIVSVLLIFLWVEYERGYDGFHENKDRIYKIKHGNHFSSVPPLFHSIKNEFPEVENIVRISADKEAFIQSVPSGKPAIKVKDILYSNPEFSDIFTCQSIHGDIQSALNSPNAIILTKKTSLKIFGKTDVIGNTVDYKATYPPKELTLTVKAVIEDFPENSTLKCEALIPFSELIKLKPNGMSPDENWRDGYCNLYVLLKQGTDIPAFQTKLKEFGSNLEKAVYGIDPDSERAKDRELGIINISEIYFFDNSKKQLINYISLIGLLVLLIAIINYINLSITRLFSFHTSFLIRKINGASRFRMILKIISESIQISIISTLIALLIINIGKPILSGLLNIELSPNLIERPLIVIYLILMAILIGIISGLYPALKLTSNISVTVFKTNLVNTEKNYVRKSLVVFQFVISIALISCVFAIYKQFHFIRNKELGFDCHQVVYTQLNKNLYGRYQTFRERLLANPDIQNVSGSQGELGQICVTLTREINGTERYFQELPADPDFIETMDLELLMGRNFSWDMPADPYETLIINETAIKAFELDPDKIIGTEIYMYDRVAKVIGVIKDFHFQSFHHTLDPFMLYFHPGSIGTANIKISGNNIPEAITYINKVWNEFSPDIPFEYHFLDDKFENLYNQDKQFGKIIISFSLIAILLACLGLIGLASFTTVQRTKEIGIRKVNGAKIAEVMTMLNKGFVKWIAVAFIIATPIAWYAMNRWLENFAYKTILSWWVFALAGLLALGIALITVSWQSWRAAKKNPIEALRYE